MRLCKTSPLGGEGFFLGLIRQSTAQGSLSICSQPGLPSGSGRGGGGGVPESGAAFLRGHSYIPAVNCGSRVYCDIHRGKRVRGVGAQPAAGLRHGSLGGISASACISLAAPLLLSRAFLPSVSRHRSVPVPLTRLPFHQAAMAGKEAPWKPHASLATLAKRTGWRLCAMFKGRPLPAALLM